MKYAQITGSHIVHGDHPATHVRVDLFEVIGAGIRRQIDSYDISFQGSASDDATLAAAVETDLRAAGLIGPTDRVMTESAARAASLPGT